ncbi:MAG TPA: hypothetical protein VFQ76_17705 [Longimicrobiaceae bacterium]|nr:hypothetical protein [Longimicrobiaceae bacterium]
MYLEPGFARLCGNILFADQDDEQRELRRRVRGYFQGRVNEQGADFEVLTRELGDALEADRGRVTAECIAIWEPGLALRRFPELFRRRDDDGLLSLSELDAIAPGVYRIGELAVFAHGFFRRGLSPLNTLNGAFLRTLQDLDPEVRPRVALDPDMVGLARTYVWRVEHQYWWGPPFSDDLAGIPTGVTRHEASDKERLHHGISRTEFWWQSRKGEHILEVEELRDSSSFSMQADAPFGCRYAHSIVTEESGRVVHFDGAVRAYTEEQMIERLEVDLRMTGRDKQYTKLWRIDGDVDLPTWKRLLSDYFRDNSLVGEYLGAEVESHDLLEADGAGGRRQAPPRSRVDDLVVVREGDGARMALSFCPPLPAAAARTVVPLLTFGPEGEEAPFVEMPTLELVKVLRRSGEEVEFSEAVSLHDTDDLYYNLPMVWHRSAADVAATVEAIRVLTGAWIAREIDGALSVTLAYPVGEVGFMISLRGHVADVARLLSTWDKRVRPHLSTPEVVTDALAELLGEWTPTQDDHPTFEGAFHLGFLDLPRIHLDREEVSLSVDPDDGSLHADLTLKVSTDPGLAEAVECRQLTMRLMSSLMEPGCGKCGGRYRTCLCSSLLDHTEVHMEGASFATIVLTDRPA